MEETITVIYPEQVFSPIQYHSFRVGGLTYTTNIKSSESPEQAYERAWKFVESQVRTQYLELSKQFWQRYEMEAGGK